MINVNSYGKRLINWWNVALHASFYRIPLPNFCEDFPELTNLEIISNNNSLLPDLNLLPKKLKILKLKCHKY